MSIIQDGQIELQTTLDNGTTVVIERLTRGAIMGSYLFLVADKNIVTAVCTSNVQIYTIERDRFTQLVQHDSQLLKKLLTITD